MSSASEVDSPILSEQFRAAVAALDQALQHAEAAYAMVQIADDGMARIGRILAHMAAIAVQAAKPPGPHNQGKRNDLNGDLKGGLEQSLAKISQVVDSTKFGPSRLLDGSLGCRGAAVGEGLSFYGAGPRTRSSPPNGYAVRVTTQPRGAFAQGDTALTAQIIMSGLKLYIREGLRLAQVDADPGMAQWELAAALEGRAREHGIDVAVSLTADNRLALRHRSYGSAHRIVLDSSVAGVLSLANGQPRVVENGRDIRGSINGEPAQGHGETLTGCAGNPNTEGLSIQFTGAAALPDAEDHTASGSGRELRQIADRIKNPIAGTNEVGRVIIAQRAQLLRLHAGDAHPVALRIDEMHPAYLGRNVENASGFNNLESIDVDSPEAARDALLVIDQAQDEITAMRNGLYELSSGPLDAVIGKLRSQARDLTTRSHGWAGPESIKGLAGAVTRAMSGDAMLALAAQGEAPMGVLMRLTSPVGAHDQHLLRN